MAKTTRLVIVISPEIREALKTAARREGLTTSDWVRELILSRLPKRAKLRETLNPPGRPMKEGEE